MKGTDHAHTCPSSGIWRFADILPEIKNEYRVTLGEGNTPLVKSMAIAGELGLENVFFKLESLNPTGSYKDRIAACNISLALQKQKRACIGTSSGNAGAAIAAYATRAGLPYHLLVQEQMSAAKMMQMKLYGARIKQVKGFGNSSEIGERVFSFIQREAEQNNWELCITAFRYNALAMQAVKTIAYELVEDLQGKAPDYVFVPVGGGGLCTGIMMGFRQWFAQENEKLTTQIAAIQSKGCNNVTRAWKAGLKTPAEGDSTSRISGLQVPNPPDGVQVLEYLHDGLGWADAVTEEEIWHWQEKLAVQEGILGEPAAAVSVAGLAQAVQRGGIPRTAKVVCLITGAGFKDQASLETMYKKCDRTPLLSIDDLEREGVE